MRTLTITVYGKDGGITYRTTGRSIDSMYTKMDVEEIYGSELEEGDATKVVLEVVDN